MGEQCEVSPSKLNRKFSAMGVLRQNELDNAFSTGTGLECAGFAGPVRWLWALDSSAKTRNKNDRWGLTRCRSDA